MKQSSVRGTPVTSISRNNGQGWLSPGAKPAGYSGTVNKQFEGDQKGNNQVGIASGTPYQTASINDDIQPAPNRSKYGIVLSENGMNMADPKQNGNGVLFDGVSREHGYLAPDAHTMDSPVPQGAPHFDTRTIAQENIAHLGVGAVPGREADDILSIGGVISRGMDGTSHANGGEMELLEDDLLRNEGRGGAVG